MPFSFVFAFVFIAFALVSPIIAAGIICALCVGRWRDAGKRMACGSVLLGVVSAVAYSSLNAAFGDSSPPVPIAVAFVSGAGFTCGALAAGG